MRPDTHGCMLDGAETVSYDLYRFSTTVLQWEKLDASRVSGSPPSVAWWRYHYAMAAVGSDLFVFRSSDYSEILGGSDLYRFSTTDLQWEELDATQVSGSSPASSSRSVMVAVGSDLFEIGTREGSGSACDNYFYRFSTTDLQWEQLDASRVSASLTTCREGSAIAAYGSDLFLFGGTEGPPGYPLWMSTTSDELLRFSTTDLQWEQFDAVRITGSPPSARSCHAMVVADSDLFVFGGTLDSGPGESLGYSNELLRFNTTDLQWEKLEEALVSGSPPSARANHAMAAVGSSLYVFGGYAEPTNNTDPGEEARCDSTIRVYMHV